MRELEEKYEGYTVYDNRGERIGKVDDLFIYEADRGSTSGSRWASSGASPP
jgi:sporulation protein YlmC with PRC-barrel domain